MTSYDFMKRFKVFLWSFLFSLLLCFNVYSFEHKITFNWVDGWVGEGPIAKIIDSNSYKYFHDLPEEFEVPLYTVNNASLDISGYYIDDGNEVSVQGFGVGSLKSGGYWGFKWFRFLDEPSSTHFDISSKFEISWEKGSLLEVLITNGGGQFGDGFFKIKESVFTLEYEKAPLAHSPEPSTMILLGLGLVAVGFVWRKSIKKD